jgi:hypothetical protein
MKKVFNKNILLALLTTAVMVFLIVASNASAFAFTGDNANISDQSDTDVYYQYGYGEPTQNLPEGTTDIRGFSATDGRFLKDADAYSVDGKASIHIPSGTIGLDKDLQALQTISIEKVSPAPTPPDGYFVVGNAYNFGPSGATFDPAVTINFTVDPKDLEGVDLSKIKIAIYVYDKTTGQYHWTDLKNIHYNPDTKTISGDTNEFTVFAVLAPIPVTTSPAQTTTPAQTSTTAVPVSEPTNWTLIGSLIGVAVVLAVLVALYFLKFRKQSS